MTSTRHKQQRTAARFFFTYLFFIGTIVAAIGWLAEWKQLGAILPIFQHSAIIAAIGHAAQVIGAFFSLITPDRTEEETEEDSRD
jgi:hypothetical protein